MRGKEERLVELIVKLPFLCHDVRLSIEENSPLPMNWVGNQSCSYLPRCFTAKRW